MQNMETLCPSTTRVVVAPTVRQGERYSIEKAEEANAAMQCDGYAHVGQVSNGKRACGTASNREMQMMSDASRLVRPEAVAQWSAAQTATDQYCQVARAEYDASSRCIGVHRAAGRFGQSRP